MMSCLAHTAGGGIANDTASIPAAASLTSYELRFILLLCQAVIFSHGVLRYVGNTHICWGNCVAACCSNGRHNLNIVYSSLAALVGPRCRFGTLTQKLNTVAS